MMSIGELSRRSGVKVPTIRYYEEIGLIAAPGRTGGNQRRYGQSDLDRLSFIRHARDLGFAIPAIRDLLGLAESPGQPCAAADAVARARLAEVEERIARLRALEAELHRMLDQCAGGRIEDCRVIEELNDHSLCSVDEHGAAERPI
jgi:DNA-binding transcriptional MerR regulator